MSKRDDFQNGLPDSVREDVKEYLDDIENRVNEIKDKLDIGSLADMSGIEEAYALSVDLSDDLY